MKQTAPFSVPFRSWNFDNIKQVIRILFFSVGIFLTSNDLYGQDCFAQVASASSDIPSGTIRPFCNSSGFTVNAGIDHDENCISDVYVILEAQYGNHSLPTFFDGSVLSPIDRYFSNIQYAPASGSPVLTEVTTSANGGSVMLIFRFRMQMPPEAGTDAFTFPFTFAPNFFFGDLPWNVWVSAQAADSNGAPQLPDFPPSPQANVPSILAGTLLFEQPYFPIVGSQNVSTFYNDLTTHWSAPNFNRTHSIMLLPDASGAPPVLTVDVPLLILGFFSSGGPSPQTVGGQLIMPPGGKVKVLNNSILAIGYSKVFTCGDEVSKGIVVEAGGRLDQENSTFSDAELAIHLKKGSHLGSSGEFLKVSNNYKGIRIDNTGGSNIPDIDVKFSYNTIFENTSTLKLPYPGMPQPSTTKGYGLEIVDHPHVTLNRGSFNNLNNGVRLLRSSFTTRAGFANIRADAGSGVAHQGWAVWGLGISEETFNYTSPFEWLGPADKGIYLRNMNVLIDDADILADAGIYLDNCKMKMVSIARCSLYCRYSAIRSSNCLPLKDGSIIYDNFIEMDNSAIPIPAGNGILLAEGSQIKDPFIGWILEKTVMNMNGVRWGIRGLGVYNSEFLTNHIEIFNNFPNVTGIDVMATTSLNAANNRVFTTVAGSTAKGYLFNKVDRSRYTCNKADKMNVGMEFSNGCEATVLKGSEFNNTPTGLLLGNNVALGKQGVDGAGIIVQDHGNSWIASAATHNGTTQNLVLLSQFGVDPLENPAFHPPHNWGQTWFKQEITPNHLSFSCLNAYVPPTDRSVEYAVANGTIYNTGLSTIMVKMLENRLYSELKQNPSWAIGNPVYAQFVQNLSGTTTHAFWQIQQGINTLNNRTATEQNAVAAIETDISDLHQELALMDSTYASGTAIDGALYAQKLASLSAAIQSLRTQLGNIRTTRLAQANLLLNQNAAIATPGVWELKEKQVNDVEIRLFVQDSVTVPQLALLDATGSLCQNTYGDAVQRAQVLYNRFVEKAFSSTCTSARGEAQERAEENIATLDGKIYPNPTTGRIMVPNPNNEVRSMQFFSLTGMRVHQMVTSDVEIDLSNLENGVYFMRITEETTGKTETAKLIITK